MLLRTHVEFPDEMLLLYVLFKARAVFLKLENQFILIIAVHIKYSLDLQRT